MNGDCQGQNDLKLPCTSNGGGGGGGEWVQCSLTLL